LARAVRVAPVVAAVAVARAVAQLLRPRGAVIGAGLEEADVVRAFAHPRRDHAAGRAGADHDGVERGLQRTYRATLTVVGRAGPVLPHATTGSPQGESASDTVSTVGPGEVSIRSSVLQVVPFQRRT